MTIDERLERLAERHEALTQSVELLLQETRELRGGQEAHHAALEKDSENIRALARIAEIRERLLTHLEGGEQ